MEESSQSKNAINFTDYAIIFIGVIWVLFQMYTALFGNFTPIVQRAVHLGFATALIYILAAEKATKGWLRLVNWIIVPLSLVPAVYLIVNFNDWIYRFGKPTTLEIAFSILLLLVVLDIARRTIGWILPGLSVLFLLYAFLGPYLPGILQHRGYDVERVFNQMYLSTEGIYGIAVGTSNDYIFLFVIMGSLVTVLGGGDYLFNLSSKLVGRMRGGPAKIAVVASSLFGMVSGSAQANVATTGTITIPLMKKNGFKPEFAGAVEAVASTGGQIMPPVMGAAAFLMAEILGLPYLQIIKAAFLPALTFYLIVFVVVHLEAVKIGLKGMDKSDLIFEKNYFSKNFYVILPLVLLIIWVVIVGWEPLKSAAYTCLVAVVLLFARFRKIGPTVARIRQGLVSGATTAVTVVSGCACAAIIMTIVNLTGLGLRFSSLAIDLAGGNIMALLVMLFIASFIMGMGLPTTVVYLILVVMGVPALVKVGIEPLAAHMFIFYGGMLSMITPPVAMAVYVASGIAKSNMMSTGIHAVKLGIAAYILPFFFVLQPELLLQGEFSTALVICIVTTLLGGFMVAVAVSGCMFDRLNIFWRLIALGSGVMLIDPAMTTNIIGIALALMVLVYQWVKRSSKRTASTG